MPILEDRIAAGMGSVIDESRVKEWVLVPSWQLRRGARYCCLQITGDSMEPSLRGGALVLVNLDRHDPTRLVGRLVASYIPNDGAVVRELWEDETRRYWILWARNPEHKDRIVRKDDEGGVT